MVVTAGAVCSAMVLIRTIVIAAICLLVAPPVRADFDDGMAAYERGDYKTALNEFLPLAERGDAIVQNNLGAMYQKGYGVPQDYAEAVKWYRLAAEQGLAPAQYNLGVMYRNGQGISKDYEKALYWFSLAAGQGFAMAQCDLGAMPMRSPSWRWCWAVGSGELTRAPRQRTFAATGSAGTAGATSWSRAMAAVSWVTRSTGFSSKASRGAGGCS